MALVNMDVGMCGVGVKRYAMEKLNAIYGNLYIDENVMIVGTHTHS